MGATERWHFVRDGQLWECTENDGATFLRCGPEASERPICSVEEAETRYPRELARAIRAG